MNCWCNDVRYEFVSVSKLVIVKYVRQMNRFMSSLHFLRVLDLTVAGEGFMAVVASDTTSTDIGDDDDDDLDERDEYEGGDDTIDEKMDLGEGDDETADVSSS